MNVTPVVPSPRVGARSLTLIALIVLLTIAIAFLPGTLARVSAGATPLTTGTLAVTLGDAFSHWWSTGEAALTSEMQQVVQFWQVFHIVKATVAAGLLAVVLLAGAQLLQAYSGAVRRSRRAMIIFVGILGAAWVPVILVTLLANIQGAIAPLSSVMGLLPMGAPSEAVLQVREQFANGTTTPVLTVLVEDFRSYHAAMVGCSAIAAMVVILTIAVAGFRRSWLPREDTGLRRILAGLITALSFLGIFLVLIAILNMSTVEETAPALAAFFNGGSA